MTYFSAAYQRQFFDAKQVAVMLGVSYSMINKLAKRGVIDCLKIGSTYRFRQSDIDAYVSMRQEKEAAKRLKKENPDNG